MSFCGIGFDGVVIQPQVLDMREKTDEIFPALVPSFTNSFDRNVMAALGDTGANPANVKFRTGQAAKPQVELVACIDRPKQKAGNSRAAECSLKAIVATGVDGLFQQSFPNLPGVTIGEVGWNVGVQCADLRCGCVGVVDCRSLCTKNHLSNT